MTIKIKEIATKHKVRDTIFDSESILVALCQKLEIMVNECTLMYLYMAFQMFSLAIFWGKVLEEGNLV